jgi:hypothetical protein
LGELTAFSGCRVALFVYNWFDDRGKLNAKRHREWV